MMRIIYVAVQQEKRIKQALPIILIRRNLKNMGALKR